MFLPSILVAVATPSHAIAATPTVFNDYSRSAPRPPVAQFQSWYPNHNNALINLTRGICNESYADYLAVYNLPPGSPNASHLVSACYRLEGCLLNHVPANWQANFNSASVILGLMPTILAAIGPSVADISLLSAHRPVLSFLTSMGAPAVFSIRIFEYVHPTQNLQKRRVHLGTGRLNPWLAAVLSLSQYLIAITAILNVISTSISAGRKSILSWGCTTTYAPLLWSILASVIHIFSAISYLITRKRSVNHKNNEVNRPVAVTFKQSNSRSQGRILKWPPITFRGWLSWLRRIFINETTVCANRSDVNYTFDETKMSRIAIICAVLAGFMSLMHVAFGIIIFSSMQLVSVPDVLNSILWRYVVSSIICRLLLEMEISGLSMHAGLNVNQEETADSNPF